MDTTAAASTLTVHLVAAPVPAVRQMAPAATELPHTLEVALEFLLATGGGATKTLAFTDVTRSGDIVTAVLTFATLAERDDVYGALTDRARGARLVLRRLVDLLVPVPPQTEPLIDPGMDPRILPERPAFAWPPRRLLVPDLQVGLPGRRPAHPRPLPHLGTPGTRPLTGVPVTLAREHSARVLEMRRRDHDWGDGGPGEIDLGDEGIPEMGLPVPQVSVHGWTLEVGLTRYRLGVDNWQEFSDDLFAPSPDLPPCGSNTNASRTWVDILDARSGARLYGFCALGSSRDLAHLWWAVIEGDPVPYEVQILLTDRRTGVSQASTAVSTLVGELPPPAPDPVWMAVRQDVQQVVAPEPFWFSPALHGYIFRALTPGSGGSRLIRRTLLHRGRHHAYLQDASRPWVVYVFPDEFKIARRPSAPFTPYATVRVRSSVDGRTAGVVFDYVVAPHISQERLLDARTQLLADPRFEPDSVEFQPFATTDVSFTVDRPTESGSVRERRPDAAVVLQGGLKDTLAMPLADFRLLFDAMHGSTASLFVGHVDIATEPGAAEIIPFTARMDDLEGPAFQYVATTSGDGLLDVRLTNCIESPLDVQALGVTVLQDDRATRGLVRSGLPRAGLRPGESTVVRVEPETPVAASSSPELTLDLTGVTVHPDPEAIWNAVLDRTTLDYFRIVAVKVLRTLFDPVPGREDEQIRVVVVEFEGGGTADLQPGTGNGTFVEATVRLDYPIDDVILHRPVSPTYRYTRTVIRANGQQQRDPTPAAGSADVLYLDVAR
jgi:hypothetical protein